MKIVIISDTHGLHESVKLSKADYLIHAGDISNYGTLPQIKEFNSWLGKQRNKFAEIIVINGNHDFSFDLEHPKGLYYNPDKISGHELLGNATYLHNEGVIIDGIKIYGSGISCWFHSWAHNVQRGEDIKKYWDMIDNDTNILISHGPPFGILDYVERNMIHVGCEDLKNRISELKQLKLFCCGHIHGSYGQIEEAGIKYVNASICTEQYKPTNPPIVIELQ